MAKLCLVLLCLFALSVIGMALIHCDPSGVCTGGGTPDGVTCCGGCHSCTFKGCCHCSFTNKFTHCAIPGYRSSQYKGGK
ncbi:hypothetical protein niasHT_000890 [Heterodera trifolii]|uniref:Uncharacterized protein n=1 Tax=Heterodera trifolii TaxID=157864 RepID=A0ABD2KT65_9BILA